MQTSGNGIVRRISLVALMLWVVAPVARGGVMTYSGSVTSTFPPAGFMGLGTFKPGFDPYSFIAVYGDIASNLTGPFFAEAVADGNFRLLSIGSLSGLS